MARYLQVVFMQGEEATEPLAVLEQEGEDAAIDFLSQWDCDGADVRDEPSAGEGDNVYREGRYLLTYNVGLGYIGLERVIADVALTKCRKCGCFINPAYGADSPVVHQGHDGTEDDPRAPGDRDNICDVCGYA